MRSDWDAVVAEARDEPLEFDLGGEHFTVLVPLPALGFLEFARTADEKIVTMVSAQVRFLAGCLDMPYEEAEAKVVRAMTESKIGGETFLAMVTELVQEVTARPTVRRSASGPSPHSNGAVSRAGSGSAAGASGRGTTSGRS